MKRLAVSRFEELTAYALMGLALFAGFALISWQAGDPSGSVTQLTPPTNWLGQRGASFANFNMQLFGLAALPLYATLGFWGYEAWRKKSLSQLSKRWLPFGLMVAFASLTFACLPQFGTWPLSVSFGGGLGDTLLRLIAHLTGELSGFGKFFLLLPALLFAYKAFISAWTRQEKKRTSHPLHEEDKDKMQEPSLFGLFFEYFHFKKRGFKERIAQNMVKAEPRLNARPSLPDFLVPEFNPEPLEKSFEKPLERPFTKHKQEVDFEDFTPTIVPRSLSMRPETMQDAPSAPSFLERDQPVPTQRPRFQGFDPRQEYEFPALEIMADVKPSERHPSMSMETLQENARMLEGVLDDFGVRGEIINVRPGPVVTLYELEPAAGVKSSRVIGLADDIARSMSAVSARVAVVSGRNAIGIELPNVRRQNVLLREMLASKEFTQSRDKLPIALGKTIGGDPVIVDLAKMPHLLVAGTTGSGKSVAINTMILSLLYRLKPEECRLIMVDPKMLELSIYDGIPHLLTPVVTDPKKAVVALKWAVREMEERYKKMSKVGVRNIDGFNQRIKEAALKGEIITRTVQTGFDRETGEAIYEQEEMDLVALPYIVVIVDEMADLMMVAGKEIEGLIQRLAQMARAAGIHIITATQRPSVDVITGTIKANFPTRISFQVTSKIDSRTILGEMGAEQLLGRGDMLYMAGGGRISRVHGPFVADNEVEAVVAHLKTQGTPEYLETVLSEEQAEEDDKPVMDKGDYGRLKNDVEEPTDLYEKAVQVVLRDGKCSTSYVQRRLGVGYNKAATLVERMEKEGLVGPSNPTGKREILVETQER